MEYEAQFASKAQSTLKLCFILHSEQAKAYMVSCLISMQYEAQIISKAKTVGVLGSISNLLIEIL